MTPMDQGEAASVECMSCGKRGKAAVSTTGLVLCGDCSILMVGTRRPPIGPSASSGMTTGATMGKAESAPDVRVSQVEAARLLGQMLDRDEYGRLWFIVDGKRRRMGEALPEINALRERLLGKDFRFTWPAIPTGARRIE